MPLTPGTRLGSYEIVSLLGAGGMGEVYKAKDLKLGRDVAIKVLREDLASDPERLRRFEQEARAASSLNHPNIVHIYDIGQQDSTRYIAMEYVEGKTLREMLGGAPLPNKKMLHVATQIADGLAKAHSAGIVHRDLKPANLMVTGDGFVKILDFGLAKLTPQLPEASSEGATLAKEGTTPGVVMGTVGYMSPEQAKGQPSDYRSDQFSLGTILYEMATGNRAFRHDTLGETQAAIIRDEPRPITQLNPHLPAPFRWIVERCLAKDPKERYASTQDLAHELQNLREHLAEVPSEPVVAEPQPKVRLRLAGILSLFGLLVVALALMVGLNVGGLRQRLFGEPSPSRIDSLAVLPLENLSGDPEQEYFADGMTEALINELAQIRALRVISRTSVLQYKDVRKPLPEIARELNVDAVVEGTVLRAGNRVRITAQLIHAATDTHLWANSYERELSDVLTLQSEAVRAIAREIRITVTPEEAGRLARTRSVNPEAYQLYLRGRFEWNKRSDEGFKKGLELFQQAIKEDPDYALAYAGVADSYSLLASYEILSPEEAYPKAKAAAERALEIDESLGEARTSLARAKHNFDWDWSGAETEFKRAIELAPSHATAHLWYGSYLASLGRLGEAREEYRRALQLDPRSLAINTSFGMALYEARRFDQAIEQLHRTLAMEPTFAWAHSVLGQTYTYKGMYEEAIAELQSAVTLSGSSPEYLKSLGYTYAVAGRRDEAMEVLDRLQELSDGRYVSPGAMAIVSIGLDDKDQAFEWLEKAFKTRATFMTRLKVNPVLDPLRSDPRFQDLVRRMNFPE